MGQKLTVQEWIDKAGVSYSELARLAGIQARTVTAATESGEDNRTTVVTYNKIAQGLRRYFDMHPDLLEPGDELPKKASDFAGVVIYDPRVHRAPRGTKIQHESLNP